MRATITIDYALLRAAQEHTGIVNKSELVRYALKDFVERQASKRLAALGGTAATESTAEAAVFLMLTVLRHLTFVG